MGLSQVTNSRVTAERRNRESGLRSGGTNGRLSFMDQVSGQASGVRAQIRVPGSRGDGLGLGQSLGFSSRIASLSADAPLG